MVSIIKMNNYMQHIGLTAWRKKSTILLCSALLMILLFGLHYSELSNSVRLLNLKQTNKDDGEIQVQGINNVKFVEPLQKPKKVVATNRLIVTELNDLSKIEQPSRDEIAIRRVIEGNVEPNLESEQQLGIPFVNLDTKNPYIPQKRIVHFDLKGAPPQISFFKRFLKLIKKMGATGILLEYEDMFPFDGMLKDLTAKNAYTVDQIKELLHLAEQAKLEVIPLVQTFGHVEFALKHEKWSKIREVPGSPQALCPSRNSSLDFIEELIKQVVALHPNSHYLHVGCDEVFQMGECELCRLEIHDNLFLRHIRHVANIVHSKWPKLRVIIWDDMLRHLSQQSMLEFGLGELVEPMVWVYAEDVYRFVQPMIWDKYAVVFKTAWTASAFKGAFGETLYVPDAKRHLENNLRWLDVMQQQSHSFKHGFRGIVLTGWQRYDHFAVLCELLPAAIPSLALSLIAVTHGYFNSSLRNQFLSSLSCPQQNLPNTSPFINLDSDPHLWDKLGRCMFPGSQFFRLTYRLQSAENEAIDYIKTTTRHKGWMTEYNVRHNYSLPLRVDELTGDLPRVYHGLLSLIRAAVEAMSDIFDKYTISEWIEQRIYPYIIKLEQIQNNSIILKSVNEWPSRPLDPLKDLQRLGVPIP